MRWRRGWDRPIAQLRKGSECDQGPGKLVRVCGGQPRGKEEMTALGDGTVTALLKQASTECLEVKHRHNLKLRGKHGNGSCIIPYLYKYRYSLAWPG